MWAKDSILFWRIYLFLGLYPRQYIVPTHTFVSRPLSKTVYCTDEYIRFSTSIQNSILYWRINSFLGLNPRQCMVLTHIFVSRPLSKTVYCTDAYIRFSAYIQDSILYWRIYSFFSASIQHSILHWRIYSFFGLYPRQHTVLTHIFVFLGLYPTQYIVSRPPSKTVYCSDAYIRFSASMWSINAQLLIWVSGILYFYQSPIFLWDAMTWKEW